MSDIQQDRQLFSYISLYILVSSWIHDPIHLTRVDSPILLKYTSIPLSNQIKSTSIEVKFTFQFLLTPHFNIPALVFKILFTFPALYIPLLSCILLHSCMFTICIVYIYANLTFCTLYIFAHLLSMHIYVLSILPISHIYNYVFLLHRTLLYCTSIFA